MKLEQNKYRKAAFRQCNLVHDRRAVCRPSGCVEEMPAATGHLASYESTAEALKLAKVDVCAAADAVAVVPV